MAFFDPSVRKWFGESCTNQMDGAKVGAGLLKVMQKRSEDLLEVVFLLSFTLERYRACPLLQLCNERNSVLVLRFR